ncbi:tubulin--tyrosine ligase [Plasmodium gonderi]|uniref:Tubulin--tyrosine ligase n=1 Tax=Plasmodium gonderi TaxID=77519 RepID=A0A1Y1JKA7_PLAGO|nr:tubulin--tyrosine ligase [Plasmodium gonderi]GAW81232.1 tubulin--tyrosine ligase [Plasmodium gonderi]
MNAFSKLFNNTYSNDINELKKGNITKSVPTHTLLKGVHKKSKEWEFLKVSTQKSIDIDKLVKRNVKKEECALLLENVNKSACFSNNCTFAQVPKQSSSFHGQEKSNSFTKNAKDINNSVYSLYNGNNLLSLYTTQNPYYHLKNTFVKYDSNYQHDYALLKGKSNNTTENGIGILTPENYVSNQYVSQVDIHTNGNCDKRKVGHFYDKDIRYDEKGSKLITENNVPNWEPHNNLNNYVKLSSLDLNVKGENLSNYNFYENANIGRSLSHINSNEKKKEISAYEMEIKNVTHEGITNEMVGTRFERLPSSARSVHLVDGSTGNNNRSDSNKRDGNNYRSGNNISSNKITSTIISPNVSLHRNAEQYPKCENGNCLRRTFSLKNISNKSVSNSKSGGNKIIPFPIFLNENRKEEEKISKTYSSGNVLEEVQLYRKGMENCHIMKNTNLNNYVNLQLKTNANSCEMSRGSLVNVNQKKYMNKSDGPNLLHRNRLFIYSMKNDTSVNDSYGNSLSPNRQKLFKNVCSSKCSKCGNSGGNSCVSKKEFNKDYKIEEETHFNSFKCKNKSYSNHMNEVVRNKNIIKNYSNSNSLAALKKGNVANNHDNVSRFYMLKKEVNDNGKKSSTHFNYLTREPVPMNSTKIYDNKEDYDLILHKNTNNGKYNFVNTNKYCFKKEEEVGGERDNCYIMENVKKNIRNEDFQKYHVLKKKYFSNLHPKFSATSSDVNRMKNDYMMNYKRDNLLLCKGKKPVQLIYTPPSTPNHLYTAKCSSSSNHLCPAIHPSFTNRQKVPTIAHVNKNSEGIISKNVKRINGGSVNMINGNGIGYIVNRLDDKNHCENHNGSEKMDTQYDNQTIYMTNGIINYGGEKMTDLINANKLQNESKKTYKRSVIEKNYLKCDNHKVNINEWDKQGEEKGIEKTVAYEELHENIPIYLSNVTLLTGSNRTSEKVSPDKYFLKSKELLNKKAYDKNSNVILDISKDITCANGTSNASKTTDQGYYYFDQNEKGLIRIGKRQISFNVPSENVHLIGKRREQLNLFYEEKEVSSPFRNVQKSGIKVDIIKERINKETVNEKKKSLHLNKPINENTTCTVKRCSMKTTDVEDKNMIPLMPQWDCASKESVQNEEIQMLMRNTEQQIDETVIKDNNSGNNNDSDKGNEWMNNLKNESKGKRDCLPGDENNKQSCDSFCNFEKKINSDKGNMKIVEKIGCVTSNTNFFLDGMRNNSIMVDSDNRKNCGMEKIMSLKGFSDDKFKQSMNIESTELERKKIDEDILNINIYELENCVTKYSMENLTDSYIYHLNNMNKNTKIKSGKGKLKMGTYSLKNKENNNISSLSNIEKGSVNKAFVEIENKAGRYIKKRDNEYYLSNEKCEKMKVNNLKVSYGKFNYPFNNELSTAEINSNKNEGECDVGVKTNWYSDDGNSSSMINHSVNQFKMENKENSDNFDRNKEYKEELFTLSAQKWDTERSYMLIKARENSNQEFSANGDEEKNLNDMKISDEFDGFKEETNQCKLYVNKDETGSNDANNRNSGCNSHKSCNSGSRGSSGSRGRSGSRCSSGSRGRSGSRGNGGSRGSSGCRGNRENCCNAGNGLNGRNMCKAASNKSEEKLRKRRRRKVALPWSKDNIVKVNSKNMYIKRKNNIIINTKLARYERVLIHTCISKLNWKKCIDNTNKGVFYWIGYNITDFDHYNYMKKKKIINRIPSMYMYTKKKALTFLLSHLSLIFPSLYDFYPNTFVLPENKNIIKYVLNSNNKDYYIMKPDCGSMGIGVKVIHKYNDININILNGYNCYIIQKYIDNPLLMYKKKFDFRIYILLLPGKNYPKIYLSKVGFARLCTEEYKKKRRYMCNTYIHLTNYSINKDNEKYIRKKNIHDKNNNKQLLSDVFIYLKNNGYDIDDIWRQIKKITCLTSLAIYSYIKEKIKYNFNNNFYFYQLIGLDILLDDNGKAWLLEVNSNPSLRIDYIDPSYTNFEIQLESMFDRYVKEPVISEMFLIVYQKIYKKYLKKKNKKCTALCINNKIEKKDKHNNIFNDNKNKKKTEKMNIRKGFKHDTFITLNNRNIKNFVDNKRKINEKDTSSSIYLSKENLKSVIDGNNKTNKKSTSIVHSDVSKIISNNRKNYPKRECGASLSRNKQYDLSRNCNINSLQKGNIGNNDQLMCSSIKKKGKTKNNVYLKKENMSNVDTCVDENDIGSFSLSNEMDDEGDGGVEEEQGGQGRRCDQFKGDNHEGSTEGYTQKKKNKSNGETISKEKTTSNQKNQAIENKKNLSSPSSRNNNCYVNKALQKIDVHGYDDGNDNNRENFLDEEQKMNVINNLAKQHIEMYDEGECSFSNNKNVYKVSGLDYEDNDVQNGKCGKSNFAEGIEGDGSSAYAYNFYNSCSSYSNYSSYSSNSNCGNYSGDDRKDISDKHVENNFINQLSEREKNDALRNRSNKRGDIRYTRKREKDCLDEEMEKKCSYNELLKSEKKLMDSSILNKETYVQIDNQEDIEFDKFLHDDIETYKSIYRNISDSVYKKKIENFIMIRSNLYKYMNCLNVLGIRYINNNDINNFEELYNKNISFNLKKTYTKVRKDILHPLKNNVLEKNVYINLKKEASKYYNEMKIYNDCYFLFDFILKKYDNNLKKNNKKVEYYIDKNTFLCMCADIKINKIIENIDIPSSTYNNLFEINKNSHENQMYQIVKEALKNKNYDNSNNGMEKKRYINAENYSKCFSFRNPANLSNDAISEDSVHKHKSKDGEIGRYSSLCNSVNRVKMEEVMHNKRGTPLVDKNKASGKATCNGNSKEGNRSDSNRCNKIIGNNSYYSSMFCPFSLAPTSNNLMNFNTIGINSTKYKGKRKKKMNIYDLEYLFTRQVFFSKYINKNQGLTVIDFFLLMQQVALLIFPFISYVSSHNVLYPYNSVAFDELSNQENNLFANGTNDTGIGNVKKYVKNKKKGEKDANNNTHLKRENNCNYLMNSSKKDVNNFLEKGREVLYGPLNPELSRTNCTNNAIHNIEGRKKKNYLWHKNVCSNIYNLYEYIQISVNPTVKNACLETFLNFIFNKYGITQHS